MCPAQGHNAVTPVRLEPAAPQCRVKHSTTEPLCSLPHVAIHLGFYRFYPNVEVFILTPGGQTTPQYTVKPVLSGHSKINKNEEL